MNTLHYLTLVDEFHAAMMYRQPTPATPSLDDETCQLRVRLIQEEWEELTEAITKDDALGQLDALCDLQYVISGAALALGFRSFHIASVSLASQHSGDTFSFGVWLAQFATHLFKRNIPGSYYALASLESDLHKIVKTLGFSGVFDDAFNEVHSANMRKLWTSDEVRNGDDRVCMFKQSGDNQWIAYREDGKILKPKSWVMQDLKPFVERALS